MSVNASTELTLNLPHITLAARAWGEGTPVLALHGWMDNAGTYDLLAPHLPGLRLVALDLPGHGRSQHRPTGAFYHFVDWVADVVATVDALGWERFALMGHSMGGGVAPLVAAVCPERVTRLVMIEALGPYTEGPDKAPGLLARSLRFRAPEVRRVYPDLEAAAERIAARDICIEGARTLAERGTQPEGDGVAFAHDPWLRAPSRGRLGEEQVRAFLRLITCPALVLRGERGLDFPPHLLDGRIACLQDVQNLTVPGGHHPHLDDPVAVAAKIKAFLLPSG